MSWTYGRAPISLAAASTRSFVRELMATRAPSAASSPRDAEPDPLRGARHERHPVVEP